MCVSCHCAFWQLYYLSPTDACHGSVILLNQCRRYFDITPICPLIHPVSLPVLHIAGLSPQPYPDILCSCNILCCSSLALWHVGWQFWEGLLSLNNIPTLSESWSNNVFVPFCHLDVHHVMLHLALIISCPASITAEVVICKVLVQQFEDGHPHAVHFNV